ncbi:metallophosphoesterase [Streptomyces fradiae]|uniref:metallophosphoesterase n=1 Tax=Streptomyces fradiae TaxID=1906 RepID=UPI003677E8AE
MLVVLLVVALVLTVYFGAHWYVWRRLVRDVTRPGGAARRAGTAAAVVLPLLSLAALTSGRLGAPFPLQQALAWPGFMWLALMLYLVLTLLATELVRPLLVRLPARGARRTRPGTGAEAGAPGAEPAAGGPVAGGPVAGAAVAAESVAAGTAVAATAPTAPVAAKSPEPPKASDASKAPKAPKAVGTLESPEAPDTRHTLNAPDTPEDPGPSKSTETPDGTPEAPGAPGLPGTPAAPADAARPGAGLTGAGPGMARRRFVSRVLAGTAVAVAAGTVAGGTHSVLRGPTVKRVTVPLAKLPRSAHGYRIAVVSDVHLGPTLGRAHAQRIVDAVNSTQPDLVAVVGDLVDGSVENLGPAAEPLARFRARHGSFFVTGNHEYFSGAEQWVDEVRDLGMRPLRNERVEIASGFDLAGVNDVAGENYGDGPDFARALGDRDRARAAVLLAHQPVVVHDAVRYGVDLQLSGHTHGGQMWPGEFLAGLANPTVEGLERYGDTQLYVSRGAGAWGPPVRVGAPSDITVVQLASRDA